MTVSPSQEKTPPQNSSSGGDPEHLRLLEQQRQKMMEYRTGLPKITKNQLQNLWYSFFTAFKRMPKDDQPFYFKAIYDMRLQQTRTITIDYNDVRHYIEAVVMDSNNQTAYRELGNAILTTFDEAIETAKAALMQLLNEIAPDYSTSLGSHLQVGVVNIPISVDIPDINDTFVSKPIHVSGVVTTVDEPLNFVKLADYVCKNGHHIQVRSYGTTHRAPTRCYYSDSKEDKECGSFDLHLDDRLSVTDSYQLVRLQQRMEHVKPGQIPAIIECVVIGRDRMNLVIPGDMANVSGITRVKYKTKKELNSLGEFYVEVTGIEKREDEFAYDDAVLMERVKTAVRPKTAKSDFERLINSIAPSIKGHRYAKTACLLLAAGSDSRRMPDGARHRGDVQLLFVGDPSTGKTRIAKFMLRIFFRTAFSSGRGSSVAGLTLAISIDKVTGNKRLEAGTYVLASNKKHGGLVVIDEIDKIDKQNKEILAEVLDDEQTTSKHMAGFHVNLDIRAASIHCCNPILDENDGHYDRSKTLFENTGLGPWLLSRYDAVFVFTDEADAREDEAKVKHWSAHYQKAVREEEWDAGNVKYTTTDDSHWPVAYMRYWSYYVRQTFHPKIDMDSTAGKKIIAFYLETRGLAAEAGARIDFRDYGALVRFAEASARAHHRDEVLDEDAEMAIDVIKTAMASSGFNPMTRQAIVSFDPSGRLADQAAMMQGYPSGPGTPMSDPRAIEKERVRQLVLAINALSHKKCDKCGGAGSIHYDSPAGGIYGGSYDERCVACGGRGFYSQQEFKTAQLIARLGHMMSATEIHARLKDAGDKGYLFYSGTDSWTIIPGAWADFAKKYIALNQL